MIQKITEASLNINSNAIFSIEILPDQTIDDCTIIWHEGTSEISREDIKTEMDKL